ncbi:glycoside hydrolase family 43 [Sporothrix brasiliensis 5110]|uniref:Glycoside hydrolase family 43 n=1 Tax=Sporothrix brasiliensis 5110 TaxID=1398154 RepID=A0A0C2IR61_9PEZI|nr:glycoside hydrolase family 43 [Sporothrix brasiliensis 5110]KIH89380.1 glycoside hydrolase family 43 [Sporothrix brasiliensis 5110]
MPRVRNPILPGFHADPSVLRVGKDYYIATSTFEWYPGVQIYHSTDLADWTLVSRPLNRAAQLDMRGNPDSCGVWAPCLTHDGSEFWLVYSDVKRKDGSFKDSLNYIVHAPTITGPWSDPVFANASGFDPSLFHDPDDGRKWFVNMLWDHRRRAGGPQNRTAFAGIVLQEFDPKAGRLVGPRKNIYGGTALALTEGPHLYKRNGVFYLLTAEGGTGYDHAVTLARSTSGSVWGPYEDHPDKYILTSKDHPLTALQRAGHGDIVDVEQPDGSLKPYVVHLCSRPVTQKRRNVLGRETAIQPAHWGDDGWLYLDNGILPSLYVDLPGARDDDPATSAYWQPTTYTWKDADLAAVDYSAINGAVASKLHPDLQWLRLPDPSRLFSIAGGQLVLHGRESIGSWFEQALVARRQTHFSYDAEAVLDDYQPEDERQFAGLTVYYSRYNFFYLTVTAATPEDAGVFPKGDQKPGRELQLLTSEVSFPNGALETPLAPGVPLPATGKVRLAAQVRGGQRLQFLYATEADPELKPVGPVYDASIVSDECGGHPVHGSFTGAFVGMAATDLNGTALDARFDQFVYRPQHDPLDREDGSQKREREVLTDQDGRAVGVVGAHGIQVGLGNVVGRRHKADTQRLAALAERLRLRLLALAQLVPQLRLDQAGHHGVDAHLLVRAARRALGQLDGQALGQVDDAGIERAAQHGAGARAQGRGAGRERQGAAGADDVVLDENLADDDAAPELDAEQVLGVVQVGVGQGAADDLVDGREHDVVHGRQGLQGGREGGLVADVGDDAGRGHGGRAADLNGRLAEPLDGVVDARLRRRHNGDVRADGNKRLGGAEADAVAKGQLCALCAWCARRAELTPTSRQ